SSTLSSTVVHLVPADMMVKESESTSQPSSASSSASTDAPVGALPHRYFVEGIRTNLPSVIHEALAQPHLLGEKGMSHYEIALRRQLSAISVNAGLDRMSGPGGHPSVTLPKPGRPDR